METLVEPNPPLPAFWVAKLTFLNWIAKEFNLAKKACKKSQMIGFNHVQDKGDDSPYKTRAFSVVFSITVRSSTANVSAM